MSINYFVRIKKMKTDTSDSEPVESSEETTLEFVPGLEIDSVLLKLPQSENDSSSARKTKTKRNIFKNDVKKYGNIPPEGCHIFSGYHFLLTCSKSDSDSVLMSCTSASAAESEYSESEDKRAFDKSGYSFNAEHLKKQIRAGGGVVYETFKSVPKSLYKKCRLITNRPCNTSKYVLCLSAGIDVLFHTQIIKICEDLSSGLNLQHEPILKCSTRNFSGWSLELNKWLEWPRNVSHTFRRMKICIHTVSIDKAADDVFISFWTLVVKNAGGQVVPLSQLDYVDAVVTDSSFPVDLQEHFLALGDFAPGLVSTWWIRQSLIHGEPRQFKAHRLYNFIHDQHETA